MNSMNEIKHEAYDYKDEMAEIVEDAKQQEKELNEEEEKEMQKKMGTLEEIKDMQKWDRIADQSQVNEEIADQKRILDEVTDRKEEDGGEYRS